MIHSILEYHQKREAIRSRAQGAETLAEIGRRYNVSGGTIARLLRSIEKPRPAIFDKATEGSAAMAKPVLIIIGCLMLVSVAETLISIVVYEKYILNIAFIIIIELLIVTVIVHIIYVKYARKISRLHIASAKYAIVFLGVASIVSIVAVTKEGCLL
jgi:hypothetical protein